MKVKALGARVDVVGHLIQTANARIGIPRARMIRNFGATQSFEPFDRWGQEPRLKASPLGQLLDSLPVCGQKLKRNCAPCILRSEESRANVTGNTALGSSYSLRAAGEPGRSMT